MVKIKDDEVDMLIEAGFLPWQVLETEAYHYERTFGTVDRKTLNKFLKLDSPSLNNLKVHWNVVEIMAMCEVPRLIHWLKRQSVDTLNFIDSYSFYNIKLVVDWVGVNHIMDFYTQAGKIDFLFMGVNPIRGVDVDFITSLKKFSMDKIRGMYQNMTRKQIIDKIKTHPEYDKDEGSMSTEIIERIKPSTTPP
jgi:hypothetical protein